MAASVMRGVSYARGGQLPFSVFDAMAMSEDEAAEAQMDVNSRRAVEEALAESRRG